jgi:hypothetical protein
MIVNLMPEIIAGFTGSIDWNDAAHLLIVKAHLSSTFVLGQSYDILTNFQKSWNHFVSSGQIAAFFIGIFIGWFVKGILRP